jgi:hypothetical protein
VFHEQLESGFEAKNVACPMGYTLVFNGLQREQFTHLQAFFLGSMTSGSRITFF